MIIVGSNEPIIFMRGNLVHSVFFFALHGTLFFSYVFCWFIPFIVLLYIRTMCLGFVTTGFSIVRMEET